MGTESLDRIQKIATALNAESDKFRMKLEAIEDGLGKIHIGMEVEHNGWGYGKVENKWKFFRQEGMNRTPILELRRTDRLGLAMVLERLLDKMIEVAGEEQYKIEQANNILDNQLKRLSRE